MVNRKILRKYINNDSICVECGVFKGETTDYILKENPKLVYLVDPWNFDIEYIKTRYSVSQFKWQSMYNDVCNKYKDNEKIIILRDEFQNILPTFKNQSIDWIYYDAMPLVEHKIKFVDLSYDILKTGGYMCGYNFSKVIPYINKTYNNKFLLLDDTGEIMIWKKIS